MGKLESKCVQVLLSTSMFFAMMMIMMMTIDPIITTATVRAWEITAETATVTQDETYVILYVTRKYLMLTAIYH